MTPINNTFSGLPNPYGELLMETQKILVYGALWCGDCRRAKKFFDEYGISYDWIDTDNDKEAEAYVRLINKGKRIIPTIVFGDGSILVEPSNLQLANKLKLNMEGK